MVVHERCALSHRRLGHWDHVGQHREAKTVREVERLLSGLRPGDLPTGEKDPLLVTHRKVVTLTSDQKATMLDAEILARRTLGQDAPPTVAVLRTLIRQGGLSAVLRETSKALGFTLQTVSPKLRQIVLARDGHRCTVPGCRNALFIDLHHLQKVRDGGPNNPENLITLCSAHHRQHHAGYLGIEGTPSTGLVFRT